VDRQEFAVADPGAWWFIETAPDDRIVDARLALGAINGWTEPSWFTEPSKLEALFEAIQRQASNLLNELDQLNDDEQRLKWLTDVQSALAPRPAHPEPAKLLLRLLRLHPGETRSRLRRLRPKPRRRRASSPRNRCRPPLSLLQMPSRSSPLQSERPSTPLLKAIWPNCPRIWA
jgi:hypothetical protein